MSATGGLKPRAAAERVSMTNFGAISRALEEEGFETFPVHGGNVGLSVRSRDDQLEFTVFFRDCDRSHIPDCSWIVFHYEDWHDDDAEDLREAVENWNLENDFGKAFIAGPATLEMAVDLSGDGLSNSLFRRQIKRWLDLQASFSAALSAARSKLAR